MTLPSDGPAYTSSYPHPAKPTCIQYTESTLCAHAAFKDVANTPKGSCACPCPYSADCCRGKGKGGTAHLGNHINPNSQHIPILWLAIVTRISDGSGPTEPGQQVKLNTQASGVLIATNCTGTSSSASIAYTDCFEPSCCSQRTNNPWHIFTQHSSLSAAAVANRSGCAHNHLL